LPFTYTGADFYALCSDAMLKAVTRQATAVDNKIKDLNANLPPSKPAISTANFFDHYAQPEDIAVMVTEQDFLDANRELVPSVSAGELQHYEKVRATFEGDRQKKDASATAAAPRANVGGTSVAATEGDASLRGTKSSGKGKEKIIAGKGKGKASAGDSDQENDHGDAYGSYKSGGSINGKGKGKGKAVMKFEHGTGSDDDGLY
jgi:peroxin-6